MLKKWIAGIFILIISIPVLMWLAWLLTPKTNLVAAIIDKTVLTTAGQEHISLNWILNHERLTKTPSRSYKIDRDYYGFFPLKNEKYQLKGLERFSSAQLAQLSNDADLVYVTDTYGIFNNEWYTGKNVSERSGKLYGGLSKQDMQFLLLMKARKKLIMAEFNTIGSPTDSTCRETFEKTFGIKWSGWTARFFDKLDTAANKEIPRWLINDYKKMHNNQWPFKNSGIAFVSLNDQVIILEDKKHLINPMPQIFSKKYGREVLSLPAAMKYPFWFDVINTDPQVNQTAAVFNLNVNREGAAELAKWGLPSIFPAVTYHKGSDYSFYYFSGDFCDNPVPLTASYFKGIGVFKSFFYDENDPSERSSFFWKFYRPMVTNILKEYSRTKVN
ncbi:hypothetical protein [Daejeonella lutea]|uniref:Uncharacterized protein n=1 Tax=Daejeonella lutea TaxID=572036 RepID=A0A1T5A896_9SPHI|nr:hypothetical protein [Daejeonella lutea]SKB31204.1 hypothetical protein SAMN05661099_0437 [Daejeonella lutea]